MKKERNYLLKFVLRFIFSIIFYYNCEINSLDKFISKIFLIISLIFLWSSMENFIKYMIISTKRKNQK